MSFDKDIEIYNVPEKICIVRNWFSEKELNHIMQELFLLYDSNIMLTAGKNDPYSAVDLKRNPLKKGHGIYLNSFSKETSLKKKFKSYEYSKKLFNEEFIEALEKKDEYYSVMRDLTLQNILINYYENKGEYKLHRDKTYFTAIIVLWEKPKKFDGGKLIFTSKELDFNIEFNTLVIFPGKVFHGVTPLLINENFQKHDYCGRFSIVHSIIEKMEK